MAETVCISRDEYLALTQGDNNAELKKKLNQQAGPASVSRSSAGVTTRFRSAADLIALDRYCRSVQASQSSGGCVIGECSLDFGDC